MHKRVLTAAIAASLLVVCRDDPPPTKPAQKLAPKKGPKKPPPVKTARQRVAELRKLAAATVKCPSSNDDPTEVLKKKVAKGEPCAMSALGGRYLEGAQAPRRVVEGVKLLRAALAQGAAIDAWSCDVFAEGIGTKQDLPRALRCYLRAHDHGRAALMLLNGQGTSRDVAAAAALLPKRDNNTDCLEDLRALISKGEPTGVHRACDVFPDSSFCGSRCEHARQTRRAWEVEQRLGNYTGRLAPAGRKQLDALFRASRDLAKAESDLIYSEYIDGSARTVFSSGREALIAAHFDDDLVAFFEDKLEPADANSLALAKRALARVDAAPKPTGPGASARQLRGEWTVSRRRWRGYVAAWERLAALVRPAARQALVRRLTLQRLYRCLWSPSTSEQPRVLDAFARELPGWSGCTRSAAAEIRAELGSIRAFESHLFKER